MPTCPVCGDILLPEIPVCALCGTNLTETSPEQLAAPPTDLSLEAAMPWEVDAPRALPVAQPAPGYPLALPAGIPAAPAAILLAPGTGCLVLYSADKKPVQTFPLRKDVTVIGRRDAVGGCFPDIDLGTWLDRAAARAVSRKHALLLRSRADARYCLRPLAGNTGTQVEKDMVEPLKDYPLKAGSRFILGGSARFKFDILS